MYKKTTSSNKQSLKDLTDKISARWQLLTRSTTPSAAREHKSTESILRDLIAIPTVTGNREAIREGMQYVDSFLSSRGMHVTRLEWNGVESLVATTRNTKQPTVFLAAHIDVVAAPTHQFELQFKDGKYYGRGVLDMKGALAAYLGAVQQLQDDLKEYDFGIMIMSDEEVGGLDGAANLAEAGFIPKVMVLPDGGLNNWDMEKFAKGIWWITLEASGKNAHGSRPWEGENAIETVITAVKEIQALFTGIGPETNTISLDVIQGGQAINQVPSSASASMDMRLVNFEEQKRIYAEVTKIAKRYNLTLTTEIEADPMINDITSSYLTLYKECTEEIIGRPINWVVSNAGNDGRFFVAKGADCAIAYPLGGGHHGGSEWLDGKALDQMQLLFVNYLKKVARKPGGTTIASDKHSAV